MPPRSGAYPWYNDLVADHLKKTFKNRASYDAFAIIGFSLGALVQRLGLDDPAGRRDVAHSRSQWIVLFTSERENVGQKGFDALIHRAFPPCHDARMAGPVTLPKNFLGPEWGNTFAKSRSHAPHPGAENIKGTLLPNLLPNAVGRAMMKTDNERCDSSVNAYKTGRLATN
jgi:hypothetical protein